MSRSTAFDVNLPWNCPCCVDIPPYEPYPPLLILMQNSNQIYVFFKTYFPNRCLLLITSMSPMTILCTIWNILLKICMPCYAINNTRSQTTLRVSIWLFCSWLSGELFIVHIDYLLPLFIER